MNYSSCIFHLYCGGDVVVCPVGCPNCGMVLLVCNQVCWYGRILLRIGLSCWFATRFAGGLFSFNLKCEVRHNLFNVNMLVTVKSIQENKGQHAEQL